MKRFYLDKETSDKLTIEGELYNYMKNVLRLKVGDSFIAFSGDEFDHSCEITKIGKGYIEFKFAMRHYNVCNPTIKMDLFQALAKGEKLELVTQKATEIGATNLYLMHTQNCDVKIDTTKPKRLEKITINACQQCGRSSLLNILEPKELPELLPLLSDYDVVLFANISEDSKLIYEVLNKYKPFQSVACIVGPEGGFSPEEIELLAGVAESVTLGKRVLRTETAGLYMLSIVNDFCGV